MLGLLQLAGLFSSRTIIISKSWKKSNEGFPFFYDKNLHDKASEQENSYQHNDQEYGYLPRELLDPALWYCGCLFFSFIQYTGYFWIEWRMALGFILISILTMAYKFRGGLDEKATAILPKLNHFSKQVTNFLEGLANQKLCKSKNWLSTMSSSNNDFEQAWKVTMAKKALWRSDDVL